MASIVFVGKTNIIYPRLRDRLQLSDNPTENNQIILAKTILPITNIDDLLAAAALAEETKSLTGAAGTQVPYFTTPTGKRWRIMALYRFATTGNSNLYITDGTSQMRLSVSAVTAAFLGLGKDFYINEGWQVGMLASGNAGDGAIKLQIWYTEEDAFGN